MGPVVGRGKKKKKRGEGFSLTQPWCSGCGFASLPKEPHAWSSAGVQDSRQEFIMRTLNSITPLKFIVCEDFLEVKLKSVRNKV